MARDGDDGGGNGYGEESKGVGPELRAEPPFRLRASQVWNDDHPERLGAEHQDEVDAVGRHEPVRPDVATELVSEECAGDGGGETQRYI